MASHIELKCDLSFLVINALIARNIKDIELNDKMTLHSALLTSNENKLMAIATVSGAYDGDVHITFMPRYIKEQFKFVLDDLDIRMASTNIFARGANFMVNKMFGNTIDTKMEEIINQQIATAKDEWIDKLANFEMAPNIFFSLKDPKVDFKQFTVQSDGVSCQIIADGELQINSSKEILA